jgi:hypothetical protein
MPKKSLLSNKERMCIQLRFGRSLLLKIDKSAAKLGISRNSWISEAMVNYLIHPTVKCRIASANMLLTDKVSCMIRLDPQLVTVVDEALAGTKINRTVWATDACLARLNTLSKS